MVMKTGYIISIMLSAALVLAACEKEKAIQETSEDTGLLTLEGGIGVPGSRIHFTGDFDTYTETRWQEEDCIWVRSSTQPMWERGSSFSTSAADISSDGHTAKFTGRLRADGKLAAVYPYAAVIDGSNNDKVMLEIPQSRPLVKDDCPAQANAAAAFWADGSKGFAMKYLFGAIKFSLKGAGEQVSRFELTDITSANALWGTCTVTPNYDAKDIESVAMSNDLGTRNKISLEGSVTMDATTPYDFYFILPEGSLKSGFVLKAFDAEGKEVGRVYSEKDNSIVRGKVVKMPVAQLEVGGSTAVKFEGSGTSEAPYLIASSENLLYLSNVLNAAATYEEYANKYYRQTVDIDMTGLDFVPVGNLVAQPFKGNYDGGSFKIAGLSTAGTDSDNPASGVFGYADGATVSHLKVDGRVNTGALVRTGGIIGYANNCTVSDCHFVGGDLTATANMVGGIIGEAVGGSISSCSMMGGKVSNTKNYAAGIVAYAHNGTAISSCSLLAGAEVTAANEIGGIVGKLDAGSISNCSATGAKLSCSSEDVGAIAGWVVSGSSIESCTVSNSTVTSGTSYAGGIVGLFQGSTATGCSVSGSTISGVKNCIGGIIGYIKVNNSTLNNCTVVGETTVSGVQNIGGICGWLDVGTIKNCSFKGSSKVIASGDGAGGIIGRAICKSGGSNTIDNCYIDNVEVRGTYSVAGIIGYTYPDSNGVLQILNSGVRSGIIRATACDTGGDPAKGDSMAGGMFGWARFSDSGSKGYVVNCYTHVSAGGFVCDLAMSHPSLGGLVGYASVSSTGALQFLNCVTSTVMNDIMLAGSVGSSATQVGALYGKLPDSAVISVSDCHYISGDLVIGVAGGSVVLSNNTAHEAAEFIDGSTVIGALNTWATAHTEYTLKSWVNAGGVPVTAE